MQSCFRSQDSVDHNGQIWSPCCSVCQKNRWGFQGVKRWVEFNTMVFSWIAEFNRSCLVWFWVSCKLLENSMKATFAGSLHWKRIIARPTNNKGVWSWPIYNEKFTSTVFPRKSSMFAKMFRVWSGWESMVVWQGAYQCLPSDLVLIAWCRLARAVWWWYRNSRRKSIWSFRAMPWTWGKKKRLPAFCCKSVAWGKLLYSHIVN